MKWRFACGYLISAALLLAVENARSAIVFDNGQPDGRNGSEMTHWLEADDFVLNQPTRIEEITFWDFELDDFFAGTIEWQIYSDKGNGLPGDLLTRGVGTDISHLSTGYSPFGGFKEYVNTFRIIPTSLPAGTYWLALHNGELSNSETQNFFWEASGVSKGAAGSHKVSPYTGRWFSNYYSGLPSDLAFQISGAVAPGLATFVARDGVVEISFNTTAGLYYRVDYKDSLEGAVWTSLPGAEAIFGSGGLAQVTDKLSEVGFPKSRYYRVALSYNIPPPVVTAVDSDGGMPMVRFTSIAGYYYRVERKNALSEHSWKAVSGAETIVGTGGLIEAKDPDPSVLGSTRFYRVILF